jgi:hypothetical protein
MSRELHKPALTNCWELVIASLRHIKSPLYSFHTVSLFLFFLLQVAMILFLNGERRVGSTVDFAKKGRCLDKDNFVSVPFYVWLA